MIVALGVIVVVPIVLEFIGLGPSWSAGRILRWPILFAVALVVLAALYRYGPSRAPARCAGSPGRRDRDPDLDARLDRVLDLRPTTFGSYNETYGSIGAVVILLMWFWLSAFIVLLGAELNSEMEHQTERDSTTGPPQPRGRRGAYVADHVGESLTRLLGVAPAPWLRLVDFNLNAATSVFEAGPVRRMQSAGCHDTQHASPAASAPVAPAAVGAVAGDAHVRRGLDGDVAVVAEVGDLGDRAARRDQPGAGARG